MIFEQKWYGTYIKDGERGEYFPCTVPGNIQLDYADANGIGDVNYADNCTKFKPLEDLFWVYRTEISYEKNVDETVWFVAKGIDYECDILLNNEKILHHIGMFSTILENLTDKLKEKNTLEVIIYPHPKTEGADECRDQANQCVRPTLQYGWDFHPRLLVSGIWDECYIETRDKYTVRDVKINYNLNDALTSADITFYIDCDVQCRIEMLAPDDTCVYRGSNSDFTIDNVSLWWCNGQGEPNLYKWRVSNDKNTCEGRIGFKRIRLVMNEGAWKEPSTFPKSRSVPPATFELNGRRIFAKGTNWVPPEIFVGTIDANRYRKLLRFVKDANMNILRCWGGGIVNKDSFFDICDEYGIMIFQEFPLACNNYKGTDEYLSVLEQEATAIIDKVKQHVCLALWSGGNELFNNWSKMTDQSYALRLLNKLCYERCREIPFIPTAPVMGMGHGYYLFYDKNNSKTVHEIFSNGNYTAYTEFGCPSITQYEYLQEVFPEDLLENPAPGTLWELRHGYNAWDAGGHDTWLCLQAIDTIFGKQSSIRDYIKYSNILQCEGLKFIFEEARRQKPQCSMGINWCFNEPWVTAANLSIITYPDRPKPAYYTVKNSLKPVLPSARIEHFIYKCSDLLRAELFLLNDSNENQDDDIEVYIEINNKTEYITTWNSGTALPNTNKRGIIVQYELPDTKTQLCRLILKGKTGENSYMILLREKEKNQENPHALNM